MEIELQNLALSLCSWKHVDTEMFGAKNYCLTLICSKCPGQAPHFVQSVDVFSKETKHERKINGNVYYHSLRQRLG